jgi:hypothetical protein
MTRRVDTTDFIERARRKHGDRYDYSKVVYVAARQKVSIICPEHGEFEQTPSNHCTGYGCPGCGGNKRLTLSKFIERANKVHNGRYDYSRVEFKNVESKIEIICPIHGPFYQRLATHLKGLGCDACGRIETGKKLSHNIDRFLEDARRAHGDRYDYSEVKYVNALTKVKITCPVHGAFAQNPASHIRGVGCPKCGDESAAAIRTRTTEEFIREARRVHGDRYDYSKVEYKTSHEKVEIVCMEHGSFWQTPPNHFKSGCPGCAVSGFDQTKPGLLYYLAVVTDEGNTLYKIGITNLTVRERFPNPDLARIRIVKTWQFDIGVEAAEREAEILSQYGKDRYFGPDVLVGSGNSELFARDVLGLDHSNQMDIESVVDEHALLIDRPAQYEFVFR